VNNATAELHVFHIHQTDFQVLEVNGDPQPFIGHQEHVNVPYQPRGGPPGTVKILIDFRNPDIVGKFVYHCHILEHEDRGMMSVAEVVNPDGASSPLDLQPSGAFAFASNAIANTLAGFQAGSFCKTQLPRRGAAPPAHGSAAFRIERLVQSAQ
jgi:suppressor of ftsI